tara:strand:+ start:1135 stop:2157 length:1023 start_codon:yes stop_codon:yes gene_type:complete
MLYSNDEKYGGLMLKEVQNGFKKSNNISIASGYVSGDIISQFEEEFYRIAENGGVIKILVGMAFYEGLAGKNLKLLQRIETKLRELKGESGIFVCYSRKFHGKIYSFNNNDEEKSLYVGSSNFSRSGLSGNLECTTKIVDLETQDKVKNYLNYLFSTENAISILKADVTSFGSKEYLERISLETLDDLETYEPSTIDTSNLAKLEYPLSRVVTSEKSSLNVYFGKGRLARSTGKITPRPWYEVELIAPRAINSDPNYPQGDFIAYTDDGYVMHMKTSGDHYKNIRSKRNLKILGQWIKGKLQKAGALIPLTPVTQDTLDKYGNDTINFYKIKAGEYYMEF